MVNTFASVDDLAAFLNKPISDLDEIIRATLMLELATGACQQYTNQTLFAVTDDTATLTGSGYEYIFLPERPVTAVGTVTENGVERSFASYATDPPSGGYTWFGNGTLARLGQPWLPQSQVVVTGYEHGYRVIPAPIRLACLRCTGRLYGAPGVQGIVVQENIGQYSYQTSQRSSGVLADVALLDDEKVLLDPYTRLPI